MPRAILYYQSKDFKITNLLQEINKLCEKYSIDLLPIDVDKINTEESGIIKNTPTLIIGPYTLKYPFSVSDAEIAISAAAGKTDISDRSNPIRAKRLNSIGIILSKFYPTLIALLLLIFVSGAFAAPKLLEAGYSTSAKVLYGFYRIFCHQLAFRSFFLDGEQVIYPRKLANIKNVVTYETEFNDQFDNIDYARNIVGNPIAGYKVALCERDLAIYTSLALIALVFQLTGKKIKPIKWYLWVVLGLIPIAIDGFSQIPGLSTGWPSFFPVRESTPALRIITGSLFGGMTAWYMLPLMEESMVDTYRQLLTQREIIKSVLKSKK
jgi:uncharacterized membrane protein